MAKINRERAFRVGIGSFLLALILTALISIGLETHNLEEGSFVFLSLVIPANIALLSFLAIGVYFWFCYFNHVYRSCNIFALWLYVGAMGVSGYWAYKQAINGYIK